MVYRKAHAVSMKNLGRRHAAASSAVRGGSGRLAGLGAAAFVLLANASLAFGRPAGPVGAGDPLDETWQYLLDLFRMILGL